MTVRRRTRFYREAKTWPRRRLITRTFRLTILCCRLAIQLRCVSRNQKAFTNWSPVSGDGILKVDVAFNRNLIGLLPGPRLVIPGFFALMPTNSQARDWWIGFAISSGGMNQCNLYPATPVSGHCGMVDRR